MFKAKFLLDEDRLEELESFVNLHKDFGEQFPGRHRVEFSELAFSRTNAILRMMEEFKTEVPFCDRIIDAIGVFLPGEEMLSEAMVVLENLARCQMGFGLRPVFQHPDSTCSTKPWRKRIYPL